MAAQLHKKIQKLNKAYVLIGQGLGIIKETIDIKADIDTHFWRIEKALKELNRDILKQLKKENLDIEFKRIMKDLL